MPQVYPISVSDQSELEMIYEGLFEISSSLRFGSTQIQDSITKLELEYAGFLDADEHDSEYAVKIFREIKDKRIIRKEIDVKLTRIHRLQQKLSDPSTPKVLIEDFKERQRQTSIDAIIQGIGI